MAKDKANPTDDTTTTKINANDVVVTDTPVARETTKPVIPGDPPAAAGAGNVDTNAEAGSEANPAKGDAQDAVDVDPVEAMADQSNPVSELNEGGAAGSTTGGKDWTPTPGADEAGITTEKLNDPATPPAATIVPEPPGVTLSQQSAPDVSATASTNTTLPGASENIYTPEPALLAPVNVTEIGGVDHPTIEALFGHIGSITSELSDITRSAEAHARAAAQNADNELAGMLQRIQNVIGDARQALMNIEQSASVRLKTGLAGSNQY